MAYRPAVMILMLSPCEAIDVTGAVMYLEMVVEETTN